MPAFAAAAAVLGRELTVPELTQSVVLTRMPGRASAMPKGETLAAFAATGATLVIHLAIQSIAAIVEELTAALWRGLSGRRRRPRELAGRAHRSRRRSARSSALLAAEPIERTALVLVGRALAAHDFRESALYDPDYRRRFRGDGS